MQREIIRIDEALCDGCGLCVEACAEGAIQVIDGVARLVSESYCDGLGACLGDCPQGALTIETRNVEAFDEEAVREHLSRQVAARLAPSPPPPAAAEVHGGCPGARARALPVAAPSADTGRRAATGARASALSNWPVQLRLAPVSAPFFQGARVLISADCVPFAHPDFHRTFLDGRVLLVGCPKLDETDSYREKLAEIFRRNHLESVEVGFMEVPCCFGLVLLVQQALAMSGRKLPLTFTKVGLRGEVLESEAVPAA